VEVSTLSLFAAEAAENTGGLGALGLNLQSFLFQLITFIIVLLILRKYVFGRLVTTLEARRKAVEDSLKNAAATADELHKTEAHITEMLKTARAQADDIVSVAHKEAAAMVEEAESKARKKADHIVSEAQAQLKHDVAEARQAIRQETVQLVVSATERLLREKVDVKRDSKLIEQALKEAE
jgi:F-type H+-transporting ATPase subunit b